MKSLSLPLSSLILLLIVQPTAALAQAAVSAAPDEAIRLAPFEITATGDQSLTIPSLSAAGAEMAAVPGGAEVISSERYRRGRASTVEDTFALSPGVIAQSRFGSDEARLSVRGSGLQRTFHGRGLRILQDGVPLNLADGSFDMQAFEPLAAAYLNVWRGANAMAYGGSTLGGAIEYVSHSGREAPGTAARLETGSFGYLRTNLAQGSSSSVADVFVSFTHQEQVGFRRHAAQSNQRLFANIGLRPRRNLESRVFVTAVQSDSELPGSLTRAQLATDPRQAAAGNLALNQKRDYELVRLASRTTLVAGPNVWELTAAWSYKDLDHPIFQVIDQLSNDALIGATLTHVQAPHRFRAGILFQQGWVRDARFANTGGNRGALLGQSRTTATNLEAFLEEQLTLDRGFTLIGGLTSSLNRRENKQVLGSTSSYALDYHQLLPRVGIRWDGPDFQLFANVSASYEPPSFSETLTLNTARDAQTATTYEVGTRGTRGFVHWDLSLYDSLLRRELLTIDDDNNPATPNATVNAHRTRHSGVELAVEIDLLGQNWTGPEIANRLVLRTAWTYGRFRFEDDPTYGNNALAGLPPHLIRGELAWETRSSWYAGPTFEWVPQGTWIDHRNTLSAPSYALAGFRIGRRQSAETDFAWFVEGRNLLDRNYAATTGVLENAGGTDQTQFLPGDGQSVFLGLEFRR